MKSPLSDRPGCWVVWAEDLEGQYVEVFDDELAAFRSAHCGGGISHQVTWVPFGMGVWQALEEEAKAIKRSQPMVQTHYRAIEP